MKQQTLYIGDNLPIMLGMDSETVDLIYLDPPFKSDKLRKGKGKGESFDDTWTKAEVDYAHAVRLKFTHPDLWQWIVLAEKIHSKAMHNYLVFMASRIVEMHRLLKLTGSIYLHCDPSASHYLKSLLDSVFGRTKFRNEILWCYTGPSASKKNFPAKSDTIFRYTKSDKWTFNADAIRIPYNGLSYQHRKEQDTGIGGQLTLENVEKYKDRGKIPENWWPDISPVGRIKSERTGYATQKPLALLDRIIKASSNEGDLVMDPFCGCATACISASGLRRQWIGIDQNKKAVRILRDRLAQRIDTFTFETNYPVDSKLQKPIGMPQRSKFNYKRMSKREAKPILLNRENGDVCNGCFRKFEAAFLEVDHVLASSKSGLDALENYQLLCRPCNSKKGDKDMQFLYNRIDDETRQKRMNTITNKHDT